MSRRAFESVTLGVSEEHMGTVAAMLGERRGMSGNRSDARPGR